MVTRASSKSGSAAVAGLSRFCTFADVQAIATISRDFLRNDDATLKNRFSPRAMLLARQQWYDDDATPLLPRTHAVRLGSVVGRLCPGPIAMCHVSGQECFERATMMLYHMNVRMSPNYVLLTFYCVRMTPSVAAASGLEHSSLAPTPQQPRPPRHTAKGAFSRTPATPEHAPGTRQHSSGIYWKCSAPLRVVFISIRHAFTSYIYIFMTSSIDWRGSCRRIPYFQASKSRGTAFLVGIRNSGCHVTVSTLR
ncbi:hypothetical protein FH972_022509 [Carpinus fangiana]|uniref:Uncharacterized protein n=1 Tax=Carpinus fangiana TaxID=176857 RepID=A0A5N6KSS9_9ROSI|nr:hypothetical protein FH972_022509 [Carpinus fangiana]